MNEITKIQLMDVEASMPWAEVETTQHNIRITCYEGHEAGAAKKVLVLNPIEAKSIAKALKVLVDNYCFHSDDDE